MVSIAKEMVEKKWEKLFEFNRSQWCQLFLARFEITWFPGCKTRYDLMDNTIKTGEKVRQNKQLWQENKILNQA